MQLGWLLCMWMRQREQPRCRRCRCAPLGAALPCSGEESLIAASNYREGEIDAEDFRVSSNIPSSLPVMVLLAGFGGAREMGLWALGLQPAQEEE